MGGEILSQDAIDALLASLTAPAEPAVDEPEVAADKPADPNSETPLPPWQQAEGPAAPGADHRAEEAA